MSERPRFSVVAAVFLVLLGSYAFFWQSRDWNSASRLMLTYALGDRGTIRLDGLEQQTGDRSYYRGHHYSDKGPGYSLLAWPVYRLVRGTFGLPEHPLNQAGFAHWPSDYGVTLATSGLLTALAGGLLTILSARLGCGPRRAALVGLAYGLATPAWVYATLAYGHQATATFLLIAFACLWDEGRSRWPRLRAFGAGGLAAYAAVVELSVGPVAAILGLFLLVKVIRGRWPTSAIGTFALGALGPTLILLGYNTIAFGSPLNLGYAYHVIPRFRELHGQGNPLGLRLPRWELTASLLLSRYRGLLFYAPLLALAPLGWWRLGRQRRWSVLWTTLAIAVVVFLVNLSYPEWTGGWSTGPRLLLPLLPFAMLAVAAALGGFGRWLTTIAVPLAIVGALLIGMFLGVGGRIPEGLPGRDFSDPFFQVVWPLWRGDPVPEWRSGEGRFARYLVTIFWPDLGSSPAEGWLAFTPLLLYLGVGIAWILWVTRTEQPVSEPVKLPSESSGR